MVSARRFRDLEAAPESMEIEALVPIERVPQQLQVVELMAANDADGSGLLGARGEQ